MSQFTKNYSTFIQKIVTTPKIWAGGPESEIRDMKKIYPGSQIQGLKIHRIPDPNPQL
jgi:hypothetical protein